jgi:hypothetical protein
LRTQMVKPEIILITYNAEKRKINAKNQFLLKTYDDIKSSDAF